MFGVIVSGRPVITAFEKISDTQIAFKVPSLPSFNHLVIFALPGTALPLDAAAAVYIQLPPSQEFKLLGALANDKQSAIFKIRNTPSSSSTANGIGALDDDAMIDETSSAPGSKSSNADITIGISLEPVAQVTAALASLKTSQSQASAPTGLELVRRTPAASSVPTKVLAQRIIANAFNFLASFGSETVPLKSFQEWWKKFESKVERDPTFLERGDGI